MSSSSNTAIVIGAGPGGLTAAYELQQRTGYNVIVLERSTAIGGLSRTVNYGGNRMDIGGHRFFSKSDRVMEFWQQLMPLEQGGSQSPESDRLLLPDLSADVNRMLERQRVSRIYYRRKFFDYPVRLSKSTIANLGPWSLAKIGASYGKSLVTPRREEKSLEDFLVNRFGHELYATFFRDYTEKVWGVSCKEIRPEWGAQRIKGLSIVSALKHALLSRERKGRASGAQKDVETSLIERFLYPKLGPGQLWEQLARRVEAQGGQIVRNARVCGLQVSDGQINQVTVVDDTTGERRAFDARLVFSTMPINELIEAMAPAVPEDVMKVATGLCYRDFITVGLLVSQLKIKNQTAIPTLNGLIPDNWIYVQEQAVKLGRLQLFQNWSPYMVKDLDKVWLGLEYFCNRGDFLWSMSDGEMLDYAARELADIGIIERRDVVDGTVVHVDKAYPAYFGSYDSFSTIRSFANSIVNLYLIGRNGMHRYNNADHSMLTAMTAVDNIVAGRLDKENIWNVNTEQEYHEEKK